MKESIGELLSRGELRQPARGSGSGTFPYNLASREAPFKMLSGAWAQNPGPTRDPVQQEAGGEVNEGKEV